MREHFIRLCCVLALGVSMGAATGATAADIESIAECAREKQQAHMAGVDNYAIVIEVMGHQTSQYFERVTTTSPSGGTHESFVLVPPDEIMRRKDDGSMPPEALEAYADALRRTGDAVEAETRNSGLPVDMIYSQGPPPGEEPWASPRPSVMMGSMAEFAEYAAEAKRRRSEGVPAANDAEEIFANAELVGTADINGRGAWHLRSDGLDITQVTDGQQFTINSVDYWIDRNDCVPLKFHMKGKASGDGSPPRDIFIEKTDSDYRQVPGTQMLLSYAQTMRMGGVLSPAEEKQLAEARAQMAEFKKQMDAMPASQRAMMESMMGPQIEQMRKMIETGAFETEMRVIDVRVNEGLDGLAALSRPPGGN